MSLLNEMVNDLNKAKSFNGEGILLHTEYSWFRRALPAVIKALLLGVVLSVVIIGGTKLFNPHLKRAKGVVANIPPKTLGVSQAVANPKQQEAQLETRVSVLPEIASLALKAFSHEKPKELKEPKARVQKKAYPLTQKEWLKYSYNEALLAIDQEDYSEAIGKLKDILAKKPEASKVRETLALVFLGLGQENEAIAEVNQGLSLDKAAPGLIKLKAQFLNEMGASKKALALMNSVHPNFDSHPDFYAVLAALYQELGESAKAGSLYRELLRVEGDNGQYWLGYALSLEEADNRQQALEAYQNALNSLNSNSDIRMFASNKITALKG